jgi:predicted ATPase/DNA-binding NarL/FixJ family response regulator
VISSPVNARRLVGRLDETQFFDARFAAAERSEGSMVLLSGDSGVGKTRLLRERLGAMQARGFVTAWAANFEYATAAFAPLSEAFANLTAPDRRTLPSVPSARRLFERFLEAFESADDEGAEPWQKRRLFVVVGEVLERVARAAPVALVVDDAQWADPESLELLQYLATRIERARVAVIVVSRTDARSASSTFAGALAEMERHPWCYRAVLGALGNAEVRELIFTALPEGRSLDQRTIDEICRRSEGNPLFAEDLVRDALDRPGAAGLPRSVEQSVQRRLEHMSPHDAARLEIAAAIGVWFDLAFFARLAGIDEADARRVLRTARELNLIGDDATGALHFRHQLTRDVVYERMLASERREVHRRIATALEARGESPAALLAHHWQHACEAGVAATYAERAGDEEMRRYAFGSARDHYETALSLGKFDDAHRAQTLAKLGNAYELLGAPESYDRLGRALEYARARADRQQIARLSIGLARAAFRNADQAAALRHLREALAATDPDDPMRFGADVLYGMYLAFAGDGIGAMPHIEAADAFAGFRAPEYVVRLHGARAAAHFYIGRFEEWRRATDRYLEAADACGDPGLIANCLINAAGFARELAEFDRAAEGFQRAAQISDEYGLALSAAYARISAADVAYVRGDLEGARALVQAACALGVAAPIVRIYAAWVGLPIALALDDAALAGRLADPGLLDEAFATGRASLFAPLAAVHAELAASRGDRARAAALVGQVLDGLSSADPASTDLVTLARLASDADVPRVAAVLGTDAAQRPLAHLHRTIAEAVVASRSGAQDAAAAGFELAIRTAHESGMPQLEAAALELAGRRQDALEIYRRIGARRDAARLARRARDGHREPASALTKREREIADLVAVGDSNRTIAEKLSISDRTVEHHVASIFAKLAFHSRAELAAFVVASRHPVS